MTNPDTVIPSDPLNLTFTAIDFETANWYRSSACAIGLVRYENGKEVGSFYSLIKPKPFWFHPINVRVHGLDETKCLDAPDFTELWPKIKHWVDGQILVAHNAPFDKSVLNHTLDTYKISGSPKDYLCTLYLSKIVIQKSHSYRLPAVYEQFFGEMLNKHHDALADARASARIAIEIAHKWNPPEFGRMVGALYDKPFEARAGRKSKPTLSSLVPDKGFEKNKDLRGFCFSFTGDLGFMTRDEAYQFIINRGGKVTNEPTKNGTHFVVAGYDKTKPNQTPKSRKWKKAMELMDEGFVVNIINDQEFYEILKSKSPESFSMML